MHAAIVATTVTTPDTKPWRLFVDEEDILTGSRSGVPLTSISWELAGSNTPAQMAFEHWDPARAFALPGRGRVRFWSSANGDEFQGRLIGREWDVAFARGRIVRMRATDASVAALDRNIVERCRFPAGLTDVDIIQGLCGQWARGREFTWLDAEGSETFLSITNVSMPAMVFEPQSLRSALDYVGLTANDNDSLQRVTFIDGKRRLRYGQQFNGGAAPFVIVDGTPAGGQKACTNLKLIDDDSVIVTAVYVNGKTAAGSGWVVSGANAHRYGWSSEVLDAPDSDTAAKRNVLGRSFLATRNAPIRRGSFTITNTTGWLPDQVVTISSTALGLSSAQFVIRHVTARPITGTNVLEHFIEFGGRRPSFARMGGTNPPDATSLLGRRR